MSDASVDDVRTPVGDIALAQDLFVPVRKRRRAGLGTDESGPGTFTRRLVKMAVNDDIARFRHRTPSLSSARPARHSGITPRSYVAATRKAPLTVASPFWLTTSSSPSTSFSPLASFLAVTLPRQVSVSPGHTCRANRTLKFRTWPAPAKSVRHRERHPAVHIPCANTVGIPAASTNV